MNEVVDANERFEALWERAGKKRIVFGSEEDGVEIRLDLDLSPLAILKRLHEHSDSSQFLDQAPDATKKILTDAIGDWLRRAR